MNVELPYGNLTKPKPCQCIAKVSQKDDTTNARRQNNLRPRISPGPEKQPVHMSINDYSAEAFGSVKSIISEDHDGALSQVMSRPFGEESLYTFPLPSLSFQ